MEIQGAALGMMHEHWRENIGENTHGGIDNASPYLIVDTATSFLMCEKA